MSSRVFLVWFSFHPLLPLKLEAMELTGGVRNPQQGKVLRLSEERVCRFKSASTKGSSRKEKGGGT